MRDFHSLPELGELALLLDALSPHARIDVLTRVTLAGAVLPVWCVTLGSRDPAAPALAFVGGVHGLERIGTQVVLAYLRTLSVRLSWDRVLHDTLERVRLVFVPLVNPGGMALNQRANPRGVDLMRNGPRAPDGHGTFLLGGQRLSPRLPWYAGDPEQGLEPESAALVRAIERELFGARVALAVDCHSGFGMVDRLWFPYARTRRPFPHLAEVVGFKRLLDATLPHHVYRLEPQAQAYTIEGDLWDYLYDLGRARDPSQVFVPLTLEMGSWAWVRKNPWQVWEPGGSFNPVLPHRLKRTLRRHLPLFDLLVHAIRSHEAWVPTSEDERIAREHEAWLTWPRT
jgi:Zinc carboxypeptidase